MFRAMGGKGGDVSTPKMGDIYVYTQYVRYKFFFFNISEMIFLDFFNIEIFWFESDIIFGKYFFSQVEVINED